MNDYKDLLKNTNEDFIWLAIYNDNTFLSEYEDGKRHEFNEIDKTKMQSFGIVGEDYHFFHTINDGVIDILNSKIEFSFINKETNKKFIFSRQDKIYNDVIMYRKAESIFNPKNGGSINRIIEYSCGYKDEIVINDIIFNTKILIHVPVDGSSPVFITFKITSNKMLDGSLLIIKDNEIFTSIDTDLKQNIGKEFTWVVK